jgi:diaminohydroxyphosphoribosylaminopyrimidine deaminase / 5-amino-6-(5-phosphoribosylamino)uracil reductase
MAAVDRRFMAAALTLAERGQGLTGLNPSVGCIIVRNGHVVGRGWTQRGGRPHAEAMALAQAGEDARDADIYVTLEPCAHQSDRGPACSASVVSAQPARVIIGQVDPDSRTAGKGTEQLRAAGIDVTIDVLADQCRRSIAGFRSRIEQQRPYVTLKLATSLDGQIAMADGSSRWITGDAARAHVHLERARADAILVGAGTVAADQPQLDVRLPGLEDRAPRKFMLGSASPPQNWESITSPNAIASLDCNSLFVEGGAMTAASFLKAGLVDRLLLYRAPILIGTGKASLGDIGLSKLGEAHGRWQRIDERRLGNDRLDVYEAVR